MKSSGKYNDRIPVGIQIFEDFHREYDSWFASHKRVYRAEIEAIRRVMSRKGLGLEVGVGTGMFSAPLGIKLGLDPSKMMGSIDKNKGIKLVCGVGENLPFREEIFDFVLNVTTICFVKDPLTTLKETKRVLKK